MKKITIEVTEDCIKKGVPGSPWGCPIALALCRPPHGFWSPRVGKNMIVIDHLYYALPPEAYDFVRKFDQTRHGEPFSFEIEVYDEAGT